jgi:hypothetical protein
VDYSFPGLYVITGIPTEPTSVSTITMSLYNIGGPGTYPLGVGPQVAGGTVLISSTPASWATPHSGSAGSVTVTELASNRIAGTFDFVAVPSAGSAVEPRVVTEGSFILQVNPIGEVPPLAPNAGSKMSATIGGVSFNGASAGGTFQPTTGFMSASASNDVRLVNISLADIDGPGTYQVGPTTADRSISVSNLINSHQFSWSTLATGASGTVTITGLTESRLTGTFFGTLGTAPGTQTSGTISVVGGTFDIGRP